MSAEVTALMHLYGWTLGQALSAPRRGTDHRIELFCDLAADGAAYVEARLDQPTRILVCGGRDFTDYGAVARRLGRYAPIHRPQLIHGDARGLDRLAARYAAETGWEKVTAYPANWERHGKAAGPIRNRQMLEEGQPDILEAFPGGRGTAHMVRLARAAGIPVRTS